MKKACINCMHFSLWDNDWCCMKNFKIVSGINPETNKVTDRDACEDDQSCEDWEIASKKILVYTQEQYQFFV